MDLFHFRDDAPGSVFGIKGWLIFNELINYMRNKQENSGILKLVHQQF